MGNLIFANETNFKQAVLESRIPVLVDFYADWCAPCKMIEQAVEQVAQTFEGKLSVVKVNVDENPRIAMSYQVMSIPTLLIFRDGVPVSSMVGAVPYKVMAEKVKSILEEQ